MRWDRDRLYAPLHSVPRHALLSFLNRENTKIIVTLENTFSNRTIKNSPLFVCSPIQRGVHKTASPSRERNRHWPESPLITHHTYAKNIAHKFLLRDWFIESFVKKVIVQATVSACPFPFFLCSTRGRCFRFAWYPNITVSTTSGHHCEPPFRPAIFWTEYISKSTVARI